MPRVNKIVLLVLTVCVISVSLLTGSPSLNSYNSYGVSSKDYVLENGKPMMVLRNICNIVGMNISWNGNKKSLSVSKGPIVFFGDSITEGFSLKKYFTYSDGLINKGVNANTTGDALKRVNEVVDKKPDKVFIMLGTNDIWNAMDTKVTLDNYNKIITKIRSACPYTDIIIQSVLPMGTNAIKRNSIVSNKKIDSLNSKLKDMAKNLDLKYIDIGILLKDNNGNMNSKYSNDGVHIKSSAYNIWADKIRYLVR